MANQATSIAPNPGMDDELIKQHETMLDHVGSDLIHLQNQAYYRGYEMANTQAKELKEQRDALLEACKAAARDYYWDVTDSTGTMGKSAEIARMLSAAIAKAETT